MVEPLAPTAWTSLLALGFHGVAAPVTASTAAIRLRGCPATLMNDPPTYTVEPLTARVETPPKSITSGFQEVGVPDEASIAARVFRGWPPTLVKVPAT